MKQKHKYIYRTSAELQLIKNYYNFKKTILTKKNTISFICYGTRNILEKKQRDFFNNFARTNQLDLHIEYLAAKSLRSRHTFSSRNRLQYRTYSGIYKRTRQFKKLSNIHDFKIQIERYTLCINKLNKLSSNEEERSTKFYPSIIRDTHSKIFIRTEILKKYRSSGLEIQLIMYLFYINNKKN
jgi:hypothetical protein